MFSSIIMRGAEIQALLVCWLIPSLLALEASCTTPQWRGDISCCHIFCHLVRSEELAAAHLISESQLGISPCNEGISHAAVSVVVTQVLIVTTLPLHSQSSKGWGAHILLWSQINERFVHSEVQSSNILNIVALATLHDVDFVFQCRYALYRQLF